MLLLYYYSWTTLKGGYNKGPFVMCLQWIDLRGFFYYCIHRRFLIVWYNMIYTSKEKNSQCGLSFFWNNDVKQYYVLLLVSVSYCFDTLRYKWWTIVHSQHVFNLNSKKREWFFVCSLSHSVNSNEFLRHLSSSIWYITLACFSASLLYIDLTLKKKL